MLGILTGGRFKADPYLPILDLDSVAREATYLVWRPDGPSRTDIKGVAVVWTLNLPTREPAFSQIGSGMRTDVAKGKELVLIAGNQDGAGAGLGAHESTFVHLIRADVCLEKALGVSLGPTKREEGHCSWRSVI